MSNHIMLDIETWGKGSNAVIVSIGACRFDPTGGEIEDSFYVAIEPESCVAAGMQMDADTILWWMSTDRTAAREAWLAENKVDVASALSGLQQWIGLTPPVGVWGNGATFDNVIVLNACARVGVDRPWSYKADRCYRTLKSMAPAEAFETVGTYHNALDDAIGQAKHMQKLVAAGHLGMVFE